MWDCSRSCLLTFAIHTRRHRQQPVQPQAQQQSPRHARSASAPMLPSAPPQQQWCGTKLFRPLSCSLTWPSLMTWQQLGASIQRHRQDTLLPLDFPRGLSELKRGSRPCLPIVNELLANQVKKPKCFILFHLQAAACSQGGLTADAAAQHERAALLCGVHRHPHAGATRAPAAPFPGDTRSKTLRFLEFRFWCPPFFLPQRHPRLRRPRFQVNWLGSTPVAGDLA